MLDELFDAIDQHDIQQARLLLSRSADPNVPLSHEPYWRPLEASIEELATGGSVEMVRLLIEHGADVNVWNEGHRLTPLHCAVFSLEMDAVRLLLLAGANPNDVSAEGDSPLRWAVEQSDLKMATLLLQHGADKTINESGGFCGHHALAIAVRQMNVPMIQLLLSAGADPDALDTNRRTAMDYLPSREDSNVQKWDEISKLLTNRHSS